MWFVIRYRQCFKYLFFAFGNLNILKKKYIYIDIVLAALSQLLPGPLRLIEDCESCSNTWSFSSALENWRFLCS